MCGCNTMPPSYVEEVPATWPQNLALIRHEVSELERNGRASADRHYAHLKELVRTTLVTHSWRRLAIDLLFVMKYPRLCDMIVANASDLSKTVPDDATVSAFLAAFRQHPDYLGLYVCMHYCERLRFAVCRDPELRPLLRHGLDAALKWLSTPAGRQEFDSLTLREIGKADKPVVLRSVCDCVSWYERDETPTGCTAIFSFTNCLPACLRPGRILAGPCAPTYEYACPFFSNRHVTPSRQNAQGGICSRPGRRRRPAGAV